MEFFFQEGEEKKKKFIHSLIGRCFFLLGHVFFQSDINTFITNKQENNRKEKIYKFIVRRIFPEKKKYFFLFAEQR